MALKEKEKNLLKEELERKMKTKNFGNADTKKGRAQAVLNEPEDVQEIIHSYETNCKKKTTTEEQTEIVKYLKEVKNGYFPREKMEKN